MKRLGSGGFSVVEVLIALVVLILIGGAGFYAYKANNNESSDDAKNQYSAQIDTSANEASVPGGYKEYKNTQYKFSFVYPEDWSQQSADETLVWGESAIVSLISPETAEIREDSTARGILGAPGSTLVVSRWGSINESGAKGGEWIGQRGYSSLEDYLNDSDGQRSKQKIGEVEVAGQKAYEVIIGGHGAEYGVMLERDGAVYELRFVAADDKASVTEEDREIIESFKFY